MISTVTTTVSTVVTTVLAGSFALITVLLLLTLLVQKEIVSVSNEEKWGRLNQALNVVIVPLGLAFVAIAIAEVAKIL